MTRSNFAVSPEGRLQDGGQVDYSLSGDRSHAGDVLLQPLAFDARQNLNDVIHSIVSLEKPSDALLYEAAAALQRQTASGQQDPAEWAERLAASFLAELNSRS